jgi:trigger factor
VTITKEITRLEHSSVRLNLTVGKDDVDSGYDNLVKDYTRSIQLPGFRKGKVPRDVLIRKFGGVLLEEALEKTVNGALAQVFEDENFAREDKPLPYSTPRLEGEPKLELGSDFAFSVVYDVLPGVTIEQYKGLEVTAPGAELSEEDIQRELEKVRERNATIIDREDSAAAETDNVVTVNYGEIGEDGEILPGSERQDFVFTLGSGYNVYKFDDEIKGMKRGETKDFGKSFPADFSDPELAGKTKKLRVSLTALKEKKLPDLDDDFAQDVDEKYQTLEDLKNSIRDRLNRSLEKRLRDIKISKILEKIMESAPVDIPESMIRLEINSRWREMARNFNTSVDEIIRISTAGDNGRESIEDKWRPGAVRALHSRLIVETLLEKLNIAASEEEIEAEYKTIAERDGMNVEEVRSYYENDTLKTYLQEEIKEKKLFDILLSENTIKPGKKENYLDLMKDNG